MGLRKYDVVVGLFRVYVVVFYACEISQFHAKFRGQNFAFREIPIPRNFVHCNIDQSPAFLML